MSLEPGLFSAQERPFVRGGLSCAPAACLQLRLNLRVGDCVYGCTTVPVLVAVPTS
jgi:hypothetical protein|eukprot:COSAG01_NODE_9299_length_2490_cov_4.886240_3_plen_56_part_00